MRVRWCCTPAAVATLVGFSETGGCSRRPRPPAKADRPVAANAEGAAVTAGLQLPEAGKRRVPCGSAAPSVVIEMTAWPAAATAPGQGSRWWTGWRWRCWRQPLPLARPLVKSRPGARCCRRWRCRPASRPGQPQAFCPGRCRRQQAGGQGILLPAGQLAQHEAAFGGVVCASPCSGELLCHEPATTLPDQTALMMSAVVCSSSVRTPSSTSPPAGPARCCG